MRSRTFLLMFTVTAGTLTLPYVAHAAALPFLGPVIPQGVSTCPLGWGAVMLVVNNVIRLLLTLLIVAVAPLMIAYSGFLFVMNPVNPSGKEKAKGILLNTIVGLIIALAAWLIVDALMAVLYNPAAVGKTWSELVTSGDLPLCLEQKGVAPTPPPTVQVVPPGGLVNITSFACKNAASCQVSTAMNAELNQMRANLGAAAPQYQITETGVNTTVMHASGAGNLDMSCFGPCSPAQVKAAITAWPGSVKYETTSQSDYNAMIAAGVPAGNILGPTQFTGAFNNGVCSTGTGHCITAPHMSLNQ